MDGNCIVCGAESTHGCHGIRDGSVYSEHFCEKHYHASRRGDDVEALKAQLQENPAPAVQSDLQEEFVPNDGTGRPTEEGLAEGEPLVEGAAHL